jgi:hypothetical protein
MIKSISIAISIVIAIIGFSFYYISKPYKGVKIIQTDLGPKIEENPAANATGVFVIPDNSDEMHILLTRGNRLYGINSNTAYQKTSVVNTTLEIEDNGYISDDIGKFVLGCYQPSRTCFILDFTFNYPFNYPNPPNYSPAKIISYNYFTQTFSTIFTFPPKPQKPQLINEIIKYPNSAILSISSNADELYTIDFRNSQVSQIEKVPEMQGGKKLTFLKKDQNYYSNEKYPGLVSGDSVWTVASKSECAAGGLTGCDTSVSVLENDKLKKTFNCHNCNVFYIGNSQNKLLLLIEEYLKFKVGEMAISE